jgi:hypothetical protein
MTSATAPQAIALTMSATVCAACGCRLEYRDGGLRHFAGGAPGRDARGCSIACAGDIHQPAKS